MDVGDWKGEAKLVGVDGGTGEAIEDVIYKRQYRTEKLSYQMPRYLFITETYMFANPLRWFGCSPLHQPPHSGRHHLGTEHCSCGSVAPHWCL